MAPLPGVEVDNDKQIIVDSTGALELAKVPGHMVVIGGGVIGLELGSVWRRLGAKVTCVEFLDQILPGFDGDVRKETNKIMKKQGIEFKLGTKVTAAKVNGGKAMLTVEPAKGGAAEQQDPQPEGAARQELTPCVKFRSHLPFNADLHLAKLRSYYPRYYGGTAATGYT